MDILVVVAGQAVPVGLHVVAGGHDGGQLTVFEHGVLGGHLVNADEGHLGQADILSVPVALVFGEHKAVVLDKLADHKGAAPDMGGVVAVVELAGGLDDIQAHRAHEDGADLGDEVGSRIGQRDLQRGVVQRLYGHGLHGRGDIRVRGGLRVHGVELCAAYNITDKEGKVKCVAGISQAAEGVHEVLGSNLYAVAPVVLPQMEGVGQAVLGDVPALRAGRGHDLVALLVGGGPDQPLQHLGLDLDRRGRVVGVVIKGVHILCRPVELERLISGQLLPLGVLGGGLLLPARDGGIRGRITAASAAGEEREAHQRCQ